MLEPPNTRTEDRTFTAPRRAATAARRTAREVSTSGTGRTVIKASLIVSLAISGSPSAWARTGAQVDFPLAGGLDTTTKTLPTTSEWSRIGDSRATSHEVADRVRPDPPQISRTESHVEGPTKRNRAARSAATDVPHQRSRSSCGGPSRAATVSARDLTASRRARGAPCQTVSKACASAESSSTFCRISSRREPGTVGRS